jgi:hypothetical protein
MGAHRLIKEEEKVLILFLIDKIGHSPKQYDLDVLVDEYEGGKMGSISFSLDEAATYAGDLIQVDYVDTDGVEVVITLTHDINNNLLDFDFWKMDFSKLITYPKPNQVTFKI